MPPFLTLGGIGAVLVREGDPRREAPRFLRRIIERLAVRDRFELFECYDAEEERAFEDLITALSLPADRYRGNLFCTVDALIINRRTFAEATGCRDQIACPTSIDSIPIRSDPIPTNSATSSDNFISE